jgi:hypothetical protein
MLCLCLLLTSSPFFLSYFPISRKILHGIEVKLDSMIVPLTVVPICTILLTGRGEHFDRFSALKYDLMP